MRLCWFCRKPIAQGMAVHAEIAPKNTTFRREVPFHPECFEELADRTDPMRDERPPEAKTP